MLAGKVVKSPPMPFALYDDRPAPPVISNRETTPIKGRSGTPNQRASSASKISSRTRSDSLGAYANPGNARNTIKPLSRHSSARRVRRFENANLFGASIVSAIYRGLEDEEDPGIMEQSVTDAFAEMLTLENRDAMERYLGCSETMSSESARGHRARYKTDAHRAWMNVERRLRKIVPEAMKKNRKLADFVDAVEYVLTNFTTYKVLLEDNLVPDALKESLRSPLRIDVGRRRRGGGGGGGRGGRGGRKGRSHKGGLKIGGDSEGSESADEDGVVLEEQLVFPLTDSSFSRLLVHACAQYHGLKSTSVGGKKPGAGKDVLVSLRKSNKLRGHGVPLRTLLSSESAIDLEDTREEGWLGEGESAESIVHVSDILLVAGGRGETAAAEPQTMAPNDADDFELL